VRACAALLLCAAGDALRAPSGAPTTSMRRADDR
jgi:hypothetical protein